MQSAVRLAALCLVFAGCSHSVSGLGGTTGGSPPDAGVLDAGCQAGATGAGAFVSCQSSSQCACPLRCGVDPTEVSGSSAGQVCLQPCAQTLDCTDSRTACLGGLCLVSVCADGGDYDRPCDSAGDSDGTCLPTAAATGQLIGVCNQAGTASTTCDLIGSRTNPGGLCGVGSACLSLGGGGQCEPACVFGDAGDGPACSQDSLCVSPNGAPSGGCVPLGPGGCLTVTSKATELQSCLASSACECPQHCLADPGSGTSLCALPCTVTSDCANVTTACASGACLPSYCAISPLGIAIDGGLGQSCSFTDSDGGNGLCTPMASSQSTASGSPAFVYGLCLQSGTAPLGAACDILAGRSQPSLLCVPGAYCTTVYESSATFCAQACQLSSPGNSPTGPIDAGCAAGQGCFGIYRGTTPLLAPELGLCRPCSDAGQTCYGDSECCSGDCLDAGGVTSQCE